MPKKKRSELTPRQTAIYAQLARDLSEGPRTYFWGVILGISTGALFAIAGAVLAILGISGTTEWIVESSGLTSRLKNASPGVFFCFLGMVVLWRYKPKMSNAVSIGRAFEAASSGSDIPVFMDPTVVSKGGRLHPRPTPTKTAWADFEHRGGASSPVSSTRR